MHESHHPHMHGKSWTALALELVMIGVGVFLGLQVDQWKENRAHREAALASLENFRTEIRRNRDDITRELPYHAQLAKGFRAIASNATEPPRTLNALFTRVGWHGAGQLGFRHTAWDLALANQSLTYLDPRLAFAIADVYTTQQALAERQRVTQQAALNPTSLQPSMLGGLSIMMMAFYTDAAESIEPGLNHQYAAVLPRIDSAIARMEH